MRGVVCSVGVESSGSGSDDGGVEDGRDRGIVKKQKWCGLDEGGREGVWNNAAVGL